MAAQDRSGKKRRSGRPARPGSGARPGARKSGAKSAPVSRRSDAGTPHPPAVAAGPFRLGAVAGTTPGKWIDIWRERMPRNPLDLIPLAGGPAQWTALADGSVDAALVRLPIDRTGLHVIPLYEDLPVVVCAADSHLTAADELTLADLDGEILIVPDDAVVAAEVPNSISPSFAPPATTGETIATVAAGVGVVVVPMSVARLHQRKDIAQRPLVDGPVSTVALAWPADTDADLAEVFVGIVRGRTANSSRA